MDSDKRIDQYILEAQPFAQPILKHIRALVHAACPEVEETMKWRFPHFNYKGEMMCSMASFKQHCVFGFWKAALMKDKKLMENAAKEDSMGHLGRITSLQDLPADKKMIAMVKEAMKLNDAGVKVNRVKTKKNIETPEFVLTALRKNKAALKTFEAFSASCRNEYVEWIVSAKTEPTRERRMQQAIEWMAEGKKRNWKYENC